MPHGRRLTDEDESQIWELHVRRVPNTAIARQVSCNRKTVAAVIKRISAGLAEARQADYEAVREQALATYDAVQRTAWMRLQNCDPTSTVSVGYLGTIVDARRQQDRLLGLEHLTVNQRGVHLARIEAILDAPVPIALPGSDGEQHGA